MQATHSFVVLNQYAATMQQDVLQPLGLQIVPQESDVLLGYFTVSGTSSDILLLKQYLAGNHVI